jgi:hypothetical protein
MKIQKIISLDKETAELAAKKSNFSGWVRDQLRSERNKKEAYKELDLDDAHDLMRLRNQNKLNRIDDLDTTLSRVDMSSAELLHHLEQRTDEEIRALVSLLRHV